MKLIAGITALLSCAQPTRADDMPDLRRLEQAVRDRIDRVAEHTTLETLEQERVDFAGDLVAWCISQAVLSDAEEAHAAGAVAAAVMEQATVTETPAAAAQLFRRLLAALPAHQSPKEFRWTLTTLAVPEVNAFAVGGGFVFVNRPLLSGLLAEPDRGPAALAFVLAHEIGHVVLGHCRRGYQRERIERDIRAGLRLRIDHALLGRVLQTAVNPAGRLVKFLYSRGQEFDADLFALHLCRNAGLDLDQTLDAMRWLIALRHPRILTEPEYVPTEADGADIGVLAYLTASHPSPLRRLRRLRMEIDGTMPPDGNFGLRAWHEPTGSLKALGGTLARERRAVVLVHGIGGSDDSFAVLRAALVAALPTAAVLEFRYLGDGSLAHAAAMLRRELIRLVPDLSRVTFVAHGAGGLVVRAYTEKLAGACAGVLFLGVPHRGCDLRGTRFLVELASFVSALRLGIPDGVSATIREGRGQVERDLHPDSLFLRWLGDGPREEARYHTHAGVFLGRLARHPLQLAVAAAKPAARKLVSERLEIDWIREAVLARIEELRVTAEIAEGDLLVAASSATAISGTAKTWPKTHHLDLKCDEAVVKELVAMLR